MKYIKADDLIQFCSSMLIETKDDLIIQTHNNCFRRMREYINSLPYADVVEAKHGEWVNGKELGYEQIGENKIPFYDSFKCSECGKIIEVHLKPNWNFCPWCGADMRGKTK